MQVDASDFHRFATSLTRTGATIDAQVSKVVSKGAVQIKEQLRAEAQASKHFKGFARGITYDLESGPGFAEALIGPEKGKPGSLGNIAYFGTSRGGGTVPDPSLALEAEVPAFEKALSELASKLR